MLLRTAQLLCNREHFWSSAFWPQEEERLSSLTNGASMRSHSTIRMVRLPSFLQSFFSGFLQSFPPKQFFPIGKFASLITSSVWGSLFGTADFTKVTLDYKARMWNANLQFNRFKIPTALLLLKDEGEPIGRSKLLQWRCVARDGIRDQCNLPRVLGHRRPSSGAASTAVVSRQPGLGRTAMLIFICLGYIWKPKI